MTDKGKKSLPNVTLITIDCINLPQSKIAADICEKNFTFAKTIILSSIKDSDPRVIHVPHIDSTIKYSEFCIKEMWKYIDTDYALVFQHDGFILNPEAWTDEFLNYDYIGAPWYHLGHISNGVVGNGGFSLRSKRLLDFIGKNYKKIGGVIHPEDFWICKIARPILEQSNIKFAPVEVASKFSMEGSIKSVVWNGEFGWHGLNYTDISKWLDKNPEYRDIFQQKLDDFTELMRKYPVYDGTVHVFDCKKIQIADYKKLSVGEKCYDCRADFDLRRLDEIKTGNSIIYKRHRIPLEKLPIPAFEKKVEKIEKFPSKRELVKKHPGIKITNSFNIPKWKQRLVKVFGNIIFPKNQSYTLIWFEDKSNQFDTF